MIRISYVDLRFGAGTDWLAALSDYAVEAARFDQPVILGTPAQRESAARMARRAADRDLTRI